MCIKIACNLDGYRILDKKKQEKLEMIKTNGLRDRINKRYQ